MAKEFGTFLDELEKAWKSAPPRPALSEYWAWSAHPRGHELPWLMAKMELEYRIKAGDPVPLAGEYFSLPDYPFSREEKADLVRLLKKEKTQVIVRHFGKPNMVQQDWNPAATTV